MIRVLVTGASGLLGVNLALEASKNFEVYGQVNKQSLKTEAFTVLKANLLENGAIERVLDQAQPDWVIHCAALANLEECEKNHQLAQRLNTELPEKLAINVAKGGARLVYISTDSVFDGQRGFYSESDQPNPLSVYSQTKLEGERLTAIFHPGAIVARVNLYGWSVNGNRSLAEFFFNNLKAGNHIKGFTDILFCPLLTNDLAKIILNMLGKGMEGLYHVVSSECVSKYQFGLAIAERFGFSKALITPTSISKMPSEVKRSPNLSLQTNKLTDDLGDVLPDLSTGIEHFWQLYQQGYPQLLQSLSQ